MKHNLRLGFLGSLIFHLGLMSFLFFTFKEGEAANGIPADVVSTNISMEMLMATTIESAAPEPVKSVEPEPEPIKKEVVADPTKKIEKVKEKPKPKEKIKEREKEKSKEKPKKQTNKIVANVDPNPLPNTIASNKVQAGNGNVNAQASSVTKSVNTNANMAGSGANDSEIAAYKAKIRREIERHKKYSQRARMMRLQGTVIVAFNIGADGSLSNARVATSSGREELDNSALDAVNAAQSVGDRPAGMGSAVSVPISFMIK